MLQDGGSRFLYSSDGIRDIYGIPPEAVKEDAGIIFDAVHPDDLGYVNTSVDRSQESLAVWESEFRVRTPDGNWVWVEGRATPERRPDDSVIWHGFLANVDEKKRSQLALAEREQLLRTLFELSPIGILLTGFKSGQNYDVNAALLEHSGYSHAEFLALNYWDATPSEYAKQTQQAIADLKEHGRFGPVEQEFIRKDGTRFPILFQGVLV